MIYKLFSYLASLFRKPGKSVISTFGNINLTETMPNLTCSLEIQSKMAEKISSFTLNPLKLV